MKHFKTSKATQIIQAQQKQNKLSHAYLFVAEHEANDFALYVAQMILCENDNDKACGECSTCRRVLEHNHADFKVIRGESSIKKEDIVALKHEFIQSSVEKTHHKVYIIEDIDKATPSAMNALLKFLEEPDSVITALLTTSKERQVLETIRSRCLIIQLEENKSEHLYSELLNEGYDPVDAYYLSNICSNKEHVESLTHYSSVSDLAKDFMALLSNRRLTDAMISLQVQGIKQKKLDREGMNLFCRILELSYNLKGQNYGPIAQSINPKINRPFLLETVIKIQDRIRPGVNMGLLIDQLCYEISQGGLYD